MRSRIESEWDEKEYAKLNAAPWMRRLLDLNPEYTHWGPGEDYMLMPDEKGGWSAGIEFESWKEFKIDLDELNEIVHFYFSINRQAVKCSACDGSGYSPQGKHLRDTFFDGARGWSRHLKQPDVDALVAAGRLMDFTHTFVVGEGWKPKDPPATPTAEEVNAWAVGRGFGHDSINCNVLVEARCKALSVEPYCARCKGDGYVYTAPEAHVSLVLWLIHPRKGASRGVEVKRVEREDIPAICAYLQEAAQRNADRFKAIQSFTPD